MSMFVFIFFLMEKFIVNNYKKIKVNNKGEEEEDYDPGEGSSNAF